MYPLVASLEAGYTISLDVCSQALGDSHVTHWQLPGSCLDPSGFSWSQPVVCHTLMLK